MIGLMPLARSRTQDKLEVPRFYYGTPDIYDGAPWTERDIADLHAAVAAGDTLEEAAGFLCRSGTPQEVARKAEALGLKWKGAGRSCPR
jgi:hypothetical protein